MSLIKPCVCLALHQTSDVDLKTALVFRPLFGGLVTLFDGLVTLFDGLVTLVGSLVTLFGGLGLDFLKSRGLKNFGGLKTKKEVKTNRPKILYW